MCDSLGSFLADFERLEILVTKEILSWAFLEKLITLFNVFVSNLFDSVVTVNGIIRRDTSFSLHYSTLFWLLGTIFNKSSIFGFFRPTIH